MRKIFIAALSIATAFTACKKDDSSTSIDTTNTGSFKTYVTGGVTYVQNFVADTIQGYDPNPPGNPIGATGVRTFYSLERNEPMTVADTATKTWDLAFNGSRIWINGGVSGNKMGAAYNVAALFENVTMAYDSLLKVDGTTRAIAGYDPSLNTPGAPSNSGWYNLTPAPPQPSVVVPILGRTIVVRTASGKYAKIEIQCYYKGGVTPTTPSPKLERYYNFRYFYQANGTRNL